jgi:hypothetical protein
LILQPDCCKLLLCLGISVTVARLTLDQLVQVRILDPQSCQAGTRIGILAI